MCLLTIAKDCHRLCTHGILLPDVVRMHADAADSLFKRATESNPHDPDAFINYAHFLRTEKRDLDGTEALLQSAVASNPCSVAPLTAYAEFLTVPPLLAASFLSLDQSHVCNRIS